MTTAITKRNDEQITRPLKVLVPLIKRDLHQIDRLKKQSEPYRYAAGQKFDEANKNGSELAKAGGWRPWIRKNFDVSFETAERYMAFYQKNKRKAQKKGAAPFKTQRDEAKAYTESNKPEHQKRHRRDLGGILGGIDADIYAQKLADRQTEIELRRDLAGKLVEAGFRLLAKELHPDKGGSNELMRRLKAVKEALMELVPMIGSEVTI